MENPMYFGLMLMIIGMGTVFIILAFVVLGGKVTIILTNKFAPIRQTSTSSNIIPDSTESSKIAAITAAVSHITDGRGRISEIKRINK